MATNEPTHDPTAGKLMAAGYSRGWILIFAAAIVLSGLLLALRSTPHHPPSTDETDLQKADAWAAAGRLQQAQDAYLTFLLNTSVRNPKALEGLVSVRRRLAHDDPAELRRQAGAYLDAANRGIDTPEHYSAESMRLLAAANLVAAVRLEASAGRAAVRSSTGTAKPPAATALRQAQDKYLAILALGAAGTDDAMQRLVAIRRRIAHDDPTLLRNQARAYLDAASRGIETPEHYSAESMRLLAAADLLAALQVAAERGAAHHRGGADSRLRVFRNTPAAAPSPEEGGSAVAAPPALGAPKPQPLPASAGQQAGDKASPVQRQGGSLPAEKPPPAPVNMPVPLQRLSLPSWEDIQKLFRVKRHAPAPQAPSEARPTVVRFESTLYGQRSGKIEAVDCARGTFVLRDGSHGYTYRTMRGTVVYLGSTRDTGECPLRRFVGSSALVRSAAGGLTNVAGRVTIVPPPSRASIPRTQADQNHEHSPAISP
jgi:hypothetical protein